MTFQPESKVPFGQALALLYALLVLLTPHAAAQVYSGSLTGVVTDASGAAVPKATAVLTDEEKGFTTAAKTDSEGRFVLRNLAPGRYGLTVSAPGMRTYTQAGI